MTMKRCCVLLVSVLGLGACSPSLDWREVRPEGAEIQAMFPCKPEQAKRPQMGLVQCKAADLSFALSWAELQEPAQVEPALGQMRRSLAEKLGASIAVPTQAVQVPGMTPNSQALTQQLTGAKEQARVAVFSHGLRVYQAVMLGQRAAGNDAAWNSFFGSLKFIESGRP
ncbi:hypothetical protein SNE35_28805 [Paucibacter sp. R3-3]|uniref:DUF1795 domain-containing protein n=1 Tax=Roseateles agri TaxID=3098619 RepID=A0ABU5DQE3_9BURK|nr:hypothetical protein [Paucibacter sp. R3-3]MDY0748535.1 hypothetical protein [Paucibacter sp. R3-3]